jgi:hypothetical protein
MNQRRIRAGLVIDAATVKYIPGKVNRNTTIVTGGFRLPE